MKKHGPRRKVEQSIPIDKLDAKAQADARKKWAMFRETVYAYDNVGGWICSVNQPHADDTRNWFVIEGLDEAA